MMCVHLLEKEDMRKRQGRNNDKVRWRMRIVRRRRTMKYTPAAAKSPTAEGEASVDGT